jgi:hypothetical protein
LYRWRNRQVARDKKLRACSRFYRHNVTRFSESSMRLMRIIFILNPYYSLRIYFLSHINATVEKQALATVNLRSIARCVINFAANDCVNDLRNNAYNARA